MTTDGGWGSVSEEWDNEGTGGVCRWPHCQPIGGSEKRESKIEMQGMEALVVPVAGSYRCAVEGSALFPLRVDKWRAESVSCVGDGGGASQRWVTKRQE